METPKSDGRVLLPHDRLIKECSDLLPTLPVAEKASFSENLYQYQGHWYNLRCLQGTLNFRCFFKPQDTDIFVATSPKSGTTWLKALAFATIYRHIYSVTSADRINHPLLSDNPHRLVLFTEMDLYPEGQNPDLSNMLSPRLFASHFPFCSFPESVKTSSACKIVFMFRDPKDTIVSHWHFYNKVSAALKKDALSLDKMVDRYCTGVYLFGPAWDRVLEYWNESLKNPDRVLFLKYEEVKEQPQIQLKRLAEFLSCPFSEQEESEGVINAICDLCSFEKLSNLEANKSGQLYTGQPHNSYFRKGESGDWRNYLTAEMAEKIDRIAEQKLKGSGLKL